MSSRVNEKGRWTKKQAAGGALSFTQVIKQGAGQRRATLEAHRPELAAVAVQLAQDQVSIALRLLAVQVSKPYLCHAAASGHPSSSSDGGQAGTVTHYDWGGSTGALAKAMAAELQTMKLQHAHDPDPDLEHEHKHEHGGGCEERSGHDPDHGRHGRQPAASLSSRSFDLVPADPAVEIGDHALPPRTADLRRLDLITGVANLENPLDVPGFFAQCIQTLRPGGVLVLIQPLGLAPAAIAVAGAGRVLGLLETVQLQYWDM